MPRKKTLQTNCSAGELAPDFVMRQDTNQYQNGAKSLRNRRCLIGGGTKRRPGSWRLFDLAGPARADSWIVNRDTTYVVILSDGKFTAYARDADGGDLTLSGTVTNCPWDTDTIWRAMDFVQSGDVMFLTHPDMATQVMTRTSASTWSVDDFEFATGPAGRLEQPYLKFAPADMTLTCSDVTGSITLTVSGAVAYFTADHVGTYIRYHKKACLITAVAADGLSCTATVVERLPETYILTVGATNDFAVGEIVEGDESAAKGVITSIGGTLFFAATSPTIGNNGTDFADNDIVAVVGGTGTAARYTVTTDGSGNITSLALVATTGSYTVKPTNPVTLSAVTGIGTGATANLSYTTSTTNISVVLTETLIAFQAAEDLVGPQGKSEISAVSTTTNGAVTDWDEQMFSDVYGYPACVELHRNRLLFGGHATAPEYLIGSAINNFYNFNVGDGSDGDGFSVPIGDGAASRIVRLHSAEQLLVGTDAGLYYVPESAASPFRPSSIAFFSFGDRWPINEQARFVPFDNGVLVISGSTVIRAKPTGNNAQQWEAVEESILAHHLIDSPTDMAVTANFANGPERYALIRNDDGTLAVMMRMEKQDIRNFTPWDTSGTYESVTAIESHVYAATTRTIAGNTLYLLELFDQDITLDCATEYDTLDTAEIEADYGNTTLNVVKGTRHFGTLPVTVRAPGPFVVGLYYDSEFETLPPVIDDAEGEAAGDLMRIVEAYVTVKGSQRFAANGTTLSAYQTTDAVDQPPPAKNGPQRFGFMGWDREPTIVINQPDPLPLDILAVRSVVAF